VALLAHATAATATRWWAGRFGDDNGAGRLLVPGLLASAGGLLALVLIASPVAVVLGMLLFGAGFGVTQNASLALMFDRVSPSGYDAASALWSLAYDGGLGLGAAGFGVLVMWTGYPAAFAVTAVLMLTALTVAPRQKPVAPRQKIWPRSVGRSGTSR
jgi:predicted MFS family arabinose efflux permease